MAVSIEEIFDKIATALIENPIVNKKVVNKNQLTVNSGQLKIGRGINDNLLLYQKDEKANESDLLAEINISNDSEIENFVSVISVVASKVININNVIVEIATLSGGEYIISIREIGNPSVDTLLSDVIFKSITTNGNEEIVNPLNVSQFIPLEQSSSIVNIQQAEEFLDTNIFELLPSGDSRQSRIIRFFQELNALLPPQLPEFDLFDSLGNPNPDGSVDRGVDGTWTGSLDYSKNNSISYAQDNQDGNIDEEDAFIHRLKSTANDTNSSRTIEDIYNTILPYLTDILEDPTELEDIPTYQNKSSGYLKFRNLNQGIIIRNTNQDFIEGLDPNNLTYLNRLDENGEIITTGTGFTITMWVRFLDKVSEGTLFNFGNPTRDENPFGFKLETFVLNKDDETFYPPQYDSEGKFTTWGSTVENINDLNNQGIFSNSNTARFVRLQVREEGNLNMNVRDSHIGNSVRKISWSYPDFRYRDGIEASMNLRLINSTFIPEDFNEWYFICASYSPNIIEPRKIDEEGGNPNDILPDMYVTYQNNKEFWMNHRDPFTGTLVPNSGYGNKCKVEIISRSDLLRARGFKV